MKIDPSSISDDLFFTDLAWETYSFLLGIAYAEEEGLF